MASVGGAVRSVGRIVIALVIGSVVTFGSLLYLDSKRKGEDPCAQREREAVARDPRAAGYCFSGAQSLEDYLASRDKPDYTEEMRRARFIAERRNAMPDAECKRAFMQPLPSPDLGDIVWIPSGGPILDAIVARMIRATDQVCALAASLADEVAAAGVDSTLADGIRRGRGMSQGMFELPPEFSDLSANAATSLSDFVGANSGYPSFAAAAQYEIPYEWPSEFEAVRRAYNQLSSWTPPTIGFRFRINTSHQLTEINPVVIRSNRDPAGSHMPLGQYVALVREQGNAEQAWVDFLPGYGRSGDCLREQASGLMGYSPSMILWCVDFETGALANRGLALHVGRIHDGDCGLQRGAYVSYSDAQLQSTLTNCPEWPQGSWATLSAENAFRIHVIDRAGDIEALLVLQTGVNVWQRDAGIGGLAELMDAMPSPALLAEARVQAMELLMSIAPRR